MSQFTAPGNILELIPQRPPFVMVDALLWADEQSGRTAFTVTADNMLVQNGTLQEGGLIENIAQTAAARAGYIASQQAQTGSGIGYIGAIRNLEVMQLPQVGDALQTEVVIDSEVFGMVTVNGVVYCDGAVLARCQMKVFMAEQQ